MQVFKLCMKILKRNAPVMSIYVGIFIVLSVMLMTNFSGGPSTFQTTKTSMAFFTQEDTPLTDGLIQALSENAVFVDLENDPQQLQDALYYRRVDYIVRIPEGFTQDFVSGGSPIIEKTSIPGSASNVYIDLKIQRYLHLAQMYVSFLPDEDLDTIANYVLDDLSKETEVDLLASGATNGSAGSLQYHFNYMAYTFMFVLILGVSILMMTLNNPVIQRRNACSPISAFQMNLQVFLSILLFGIVAWIILVLLSFLFARGEVENPNTVYFVLNSFLFAATTAGLSYLISILIKGREAIVAVANIITLGSCFISGVFVPQELLSESVLRMARVLPTYWFVTGNRIISTMDQWGGAASQELSQTMVIQVGFAIAFFLAALIIGKWKRKSFK